MTIAVGTRFFGQDPAKDLPRIAKWAEGALSVSDLVFVAINIDADKAGTIEFLQSSYPAVIAIPVTPWGKFVMPLNALVLAAAGKKADAILFTSAEFPPSKEVVDVLASHLDEGTLAVGARLAEHDFHPGTFDPANGLQVPWNTYALWNLKFLALTGFPLHGDSPFDPANAGVEEVDAIELHQRSFGGRAKLVAAPGIPGEWDMSGWDQERRDAHAKKMASKVERPARRMEAFGLCDIIVTHIE